MDSKQWIESADRVLMHTYGRYPIVLERGDGVYLYDRDQKKYLDFGAGIAVFALGYNNQEYNNALKACEKITKMTGLDRVFLTNSGTEAVEGAIKLARKVYYNKYGKADGEIIAMNHSFHGRSMGALSVTGTPKYREPFGTLGGIVFADYNKVRALCDREGILLILDEIQCGMGRTGTMMAYEQYKIKPDVVTLAKALGCGVPVGAFVAKEEYAAALVPGDHGSTYGGNPFAAAAILKVFELFEKQQVLENVREVSVYLEKQLDVLEEKYACIKERRGRGMMQGLEFDRPVKEIIKKAMDAGLITFSAGERIIRFVPPLVIGKEHVDEMIKILEPVIAEEEQ